MSDTPRLHRSITITRRQVGDDEVFYIVKDPRSGTFLRMGEVEASVLRLLDGRRTLPEVAAALDASGVEVPVEVIGDFVHGLEEKGFVETRRFEPAAFAAEWAMQERARRLTLGRLWGTLTTVKVKLANPQRLFAVMVGPLAFLWTRAFVVWSMAFLALGAAMGILHQEAILADTTSFFRSMTESAGSFAGHAEVFYLVFFIVIAVHETAHGLTCTHFGGKVTDMGFILFYLQIPGAYCDVTDAYGFEKRSHRLWTTVAGGYTGLILATVGVLLWWVTEAGDLLNNAGIGLMVIGGPPLLIFNWNPLLRYDGYYILMDLLEAPNLMANSFAYLGYLIKGRIFRVPVEPMNVPPRLRRIYVVYGICAFLFVLPFLIFIPIILYVVFTDLLGPGLGSMIGIVLGYQILKGHASKAYATLRYAWLTHRPAIVAGMQGTAGRVRVGLLLLGSAGALLFGLFGPRFAVRSEALAVLEPWERIEVHASSPGFVPVSSVASLALEGRQVRAGDLLVRLEDPDLAASLDAAQIETDAISLDLATLEARGDPSAAAVRRAGLAAAARRVEVLDDRVEKLTLRSPIDGVVLTPRLDHRAGSYVRRGETWCVVGLTSRLRARVPLRESDLGAIHEGGEAELQVVHEPGRIFTGSVVRLPPGRPPDASRTVLTAGMAAPPPAFPRPRAEVKGTLDVVVSIDNQEGLLLPGMQARVRVYGERLTLAGHAARFTRRLLKGKVWW